MKKAILFLFFSLFTSAAFCQQTVFISGKLKMKPGTTIRFSRYRDYISLEKERLASVKTGNDSCFIVSFPLGSPGIVNISVNELNLEALLMPGLHYALELSSSQNDHLGSLLITHCNQATDPQLVLKNAYAIFSDSTLSILFSQNNQRPSKKAVDQFNATITAALNRTTDPFCKQLIQSRRVDYLMMSRAVSFQTALGSFFDCDSLPLSNPAFQSLLAAKFHLFFISGPPFITRLNLFQQIPDSLHFSNLLRLLSADPALKCRPVAEAVMLENLYSMLKNGESTPDKALSLLKEAADSALHPFNRQMAVNMINGMARQQSGTALPDFALIFPDETIHPLSSFKGKPLHVTFFTLKGTADRTILSQVADVEHLADSLGVARFVCITADPDHQAVKKYWADKKYPMQLCFAPDDYEMIDFFNAYANPSFALLDSEGRLNNLAPNFPGDQLLKQLISLHELDRAKQPGTKDQPEPGHHPVSPRQPAPGQPFEK